MTLDGQDVENTLWFVAASEPNTGNMGVLAATMEGWWVSDYAPQISQAVQLRETVVTSMDSATGPQVTRVPTSTTLGSRTDEIMPNSVSLVVSFRTDLRGRSFRGRNYVVGLTAEEVTGNQVNSDIVAAFQDAYSNILTVVTDTDYEWVVASRFSGVDSEGKPIPRSEGIGTPITSVTVVDNIIDNQRRRLPGRGR
jgi:hypothetical protein